MEKQPNLTFYAVETTGLPVYSSPSEHESQPHLVQVGAVTCDQQGNIVDDLNFTILPDGWEIPQVVTEIHGITTDQAIQCGICEQMAAEILIDRCKDSQRIAFSESFARRIIRIATKRFELGDKVIDKWNDEEDCLCLKSFAQAHYGGKKQKLEEVYARVTGKVLTINSAFDKAMAYKEIYFGIKSDNP